jgi:hypothetical protein
MSWTPPRDWSDTEIYTVTHFNAQLRDNMRECFHELNYVPFTSPVTATAAGVEVATSGAITYDPDPYNTAFTTPVLVEFYSCRVTTPVRLTLYDAATVVGDISFVGVLLGTGNLGAGAPDGPVTAEYRFSPPAGSHTYRVVAKGSGVVAAGAGGSTGVAEPGYLRVLQRGAVTPATSAAGTGQAGAAGAAGATGPQGPAGADGATGPQGPALPVSSGSFSFTMNDDFRRFTVTDPAITATSKIIGTLRRTNTDEVSDLGWFYSFNIVKVQNGSFDINVGVTMWASEDATRDFRTPPNETVTLYYTFS